MAYKELKLTDVMPFGKHKGEQIEDLIYDDPSYLAWLINEEMVDFDVAVLETLEERKVI